MAIGAVTDLATRPRTSDSSTPSQRATPTAVSTGILGAVLGRYLLDALRITAWWQRGFALGVAAHGIGTSRASSVNAEAGAYASLGMGLHGIAGAVLIPYAVGWWF